MGTNTFIEWADATLNFAWGCTKVSSGCKECYMYRLSGLAHRDPTKFTPLIIENRIKALRDFDRQGKQIIFVNSMTDTFHEEASFDLINSWFRIMSGFPGMQFLILTKRIKKAKDYFEENPCPHNVWIGTSIENKGALHRLRTLKKIDAKIKFVSFEPLLEDMGMLDLDGLQWVIVGGESGAKDKIRKFDVQWARNIRDQCVSVAIPFFYKQSGGNKKNDNVWGTNVLDGQKYLEMPISLSSKESTVV